MRLTVSTFLGKIQFTILSIIASTYKLVDAFISASAALLNLYLFDNAIIDKTLFDEINKTFYFIQTDKLVTTNNFALLKRHQMGFVESNFV